MPSLIKLIQKTYKMIEHRGSSKGLHNVISLSELQVITYLFPIIVLPYLFRVIGPEKFGLIAFAQAFVQYFCILTDYGFNVSATKEIALCIEQKIKVRKVIAAVMTVKIVLGLFSFLILGTLVYFVPKFRNDWMVYVLSFGAVLGGTLFPAWFFQGAERMKYTAQLNIIGQFVFAFCIFSFIRGPKDYLLVPLITSLVSLMTGLWGQYIILSRFDIPLSITGIPGHTPTTAGGMECFYFQCGHQRLYHHTRLRRRASDKQHDHRILFHRRKNSQRGPNISPVFFLPGDFPALKQNIQKE